MHSNWFSMRTLIQALYINSIDYNNMKNTFNTFVVDVDGTICNAPLKLGSYDYPNAVPIQPVIDRINELFDAGHIIIIFTARGMRTYGGDVAAITESVLPVLVEWLAKHNVKYNEIHVGKPWGPSPIYVDDRCMSVKTFALGNPEFFENIIKAENTL